MVGVQSLSIGLSVSLVVVTGLLVGGLSMSSGNALLDDARQTGAESLGSSLASSDKDIKVVAGRFLDSVTLGVSASITEIFRAGDRVLEGAAQLMQAQTPEMALGAGGDNSFLDTTLRAYMRSSIEQAAPLGMTQFGLQWSNRTGMQWHFKLHESQGVAAANEQDKLWAVFETQCLMGCPDPTYHTEWPYSPHYVAGQADRMGKMLHTDEVCFMFRAPQNIALIPNLTETNLGRCVLPMEFIIKDQWPGGVSEQALWTGMMFPEGSGKEMAPADELYVSNVHGVFSQLEFRLMRAVSHPGYVNPYSVRAAEKHRLAYFTITVDGTGLSDILKNADMPANSVMYLVGVNAATENRELVIATNVGRISGWRNESSAVGATYPWRVEINVRNHSLFGATAEELARPSILAHHGRHVFETYTDAAAPDYLGAVAKTAGTFEIWNEPEHGGEYWYTVRQIVLGSSGLSWFLPMLVPRASVMASIDASVIAIRAEEAAAVADADKKQKRSMVITIVVAVVAAAVLMAISVVVTNMILKPLHVLGGDMACVATMHVEKVDMTKDLSKLSEVESMQKSFRQMVENLMEYKQYMPASVLMSSDDESEAEQSVAGSPLSKRSKSTVALSVSSRAESSASMHSKVHVAAGRLVDTSVKRRTITVASYNVRGWLSVCTEVGDRAFPDVYANMLQALLTEVQVQRGVADTFAGDHVLVAHNAFSNQGSHKVGAVTAGLNAVARVAKVEAHGRPLSLSFAAAAGEVRVGQMGCQGMKKVTITGAVVPWVTKLEEYNNQRGYVGMIDHSIAKDVSGSILFRQTDTALYAKRCKHGEPVEVYEALAVVKASEDEWMYQLEEAANANPYSGWANIFTCMEAGDAPGAASALEAFSHESVSEAEVARMKELIANNMAPVVFDFGATDVRRAAYP